MTFKHKLSARLALLRDALLITVLASASCELPQRNPGEPSLEASRLLVSPDPIATYPDQTVEFMGVGFTQAGDTAPVDLAWTATGGTIVDTSSQSGRHYAHYRAPGQPGTYRVTARVVQNGLSDTAQVTVAPVPVASVVVTPASGSLYLGRTLQLSATLTDSTGATLTGRSIAWTTSNNGIASVTAGGVVTAVAAGSATITAASEGKSGTSTITVTLVPVASVSVTPTSANLVVGQTTQLSATARDSTGAVLTGRVIAWSTNNAAAATVSSSGRVTAVAAGSATITATSEGQSGTSAITVTFVPVASVSVTPASATVYVGRTLQLAATPRDSNGAALPGRTVTWATDNASVASVSSSGLVTAVAVGSATITATSEGKNGTSAITVSLVPVASVSVAPAAATLSVGQTQQLTATPRDSSGAPLTGRTVSWGTNNAGVASVSASGLVTAVAAGSATITATSGGKSGTSTITVQGAATHSGYYVSPSGSAGGNGSAAQPWNLATAFSQPSAVQPGDTLWLRGGTYRGDFDSQLLGTASAPIVVRQYPGERATIDGSLTLHGGYTWYWGFEVMSSSPVVGGPSGVTDFANYVKLINLVVHDAAGNGVGFWMTGAGGEIYGSIIYNNGRNYNQDHGIYSQNATGTKYLLDNVIFNSMTYGIHIYGSTASSLKNYTIEGNTIFNNGSISPRALVAPNLLIGGDPPATAIVVRDNMTYMGSGSSGVLLGYSGQNNDVLLTGNYFVGGSPALRFLDWSQATVSGNTIHGTGTVVSYESGTANISWDNNVYHRDASATAWSYGGQSYTLSGWKQASGLGAGDQAGSTTPSGVKTFVRPNAYEPGRGFVTIYNWDLLSSVSVDVSRILAPGARYEVRNVQNVYGPPVLSGTYGGGSLSFSMVTVASPVPPGSGVITAAPVGPGFQVFLITTVP